MEIHEQPTQYFEPQLATEPDLRIPSTPEPPEELVFPVSEQTQRWKRPVFNNPPF